MFLSALRNIDRGGGWGRGTITSRLGSGIGSGSLVRSVASGWGRGVAGLSLVLDVVHHAILVSRVVDYLDPAVREVDLDTQSVGGMLI